MFLYYHEIGQHGDVRMFSVVLRCHSLHPSGKDVSCGDSDGSPSGSVHLCLRQRCPCTFALSGRHRFSCPVCATFLCPRVTLPRTLGGGGCCKTTGLSSSVALHRLLDHGYIRRGFALSTFSLLCTLESPLCWVSVPERCNVSVSKIVACL